MYPMGFVDRISAARGVMEARSVVAMVFPPESQRMHGRDLSGLTRDDGCPRHGVVAAR
jgi:hypothetical protein